MAGDGKSCLTAVRGEWSGERRRRRGNTEGGCRWVSDCTNGGTGNSALMVPFTPRPVKPKDFSVLNPSLQTLSLEGSEEGK